MNYAPPLNIMNINVFDVAGKSAWLWGCSRVHKKWSPYIFAIKFIVAIQRNQFPILIKDDLPVDFCSWACLVPECEVKGVNDITYLDLDG